MRVGLGGTFNTIHAGHVLLFETAFSVGDEVEVGLTSDEFAARSRSVEILPYVIRKSNLARFLERYGKPFEIVMISDPFGSAATSERMDALVVSPETRGSGEAVNEERRRRGLKPLELIVIKEVRADDASPVSSTRILRGEIDKDGRLLRTLKVGVGSTNKVKVLAVQNVFRQAFGLVEVVSIDPGQPAERQPLERGVLDGALRRAKVALEEAGADFGVGIEAGLVFDRHVGRHLDVQYCAIIDSSGKTTYGHGPGFEYPPCVTRAALEGKPVGDTMSALTGIENIGHEQGSIGYLSEGFIDRTSLSEIAVLMALIPRLRTDLYEDEDQACSSSDIDSR